MNKILDKLKTMKVTRVIEASLSGVISTGSFQNYRPGYKDQIIIEDCTLTEEEIDRLKDHLDNNNSRKFQEAERKATIERIRREKLNIRIYMHPVSKVVVPSVTSVRDWDIDMFIDEVSLAQYASQSQIVHAKVNHYIAAGKWVKADQISEIWPDIVIVTQGHLKLEIDTGDFPGFLEKYPIDNMSVGTPVFLKDSAGTPDFIGVPKGWKEAREVPTVFDVKRTPDKVKDGIQIAAYCKAKGIEQGIVVPINNKTAQGWSKPVVYNKASLEGYYKIYEKKREDFRKRFGL